MFLIITFERCPDFICFDWQGVYNKGLQKRNVSDIL